MAGVTVWKRKRKGELEPILSGKTSESFRERVPDQRFQREEAEGRAPSA